MIGEIEGRSNGIAQFLDILRCPSSGEELILDHDGLLSTDGLHRYGLSRTGIALFATGALSSQAEAQRHHYNKIAKAYTANLNYPHTQEYLAYLDRALLTAIGDEEVGTVCELCCGRGEALTLLGTRARRYIGIDVSEDMLQAAVASHRYPNAIFVQADATHTPLAPNSIDTLVMLGGVHHVPARGELFKEIARILRTGGRFIYREPVSDFALWRILRAIVYRLSPMLDHTTERPLLFEETVPLLEGSGLRSIAYKTHGLLGFCLFMNSDVLFVNRFFRFVPGIGAITRASIRVDEAILAQRGFSRAGLQVIGIAEKPLVAPTK